MPSSNQRICCCALQTHLGPQDEQALIKQPENHLRNLVKTYGERLSGRPIYDIREFFHDSQIPFRWKGCPRGSLGCCGSCTAKCSDRCPQDILTRAYLQCAYIFNNPERFKEAPTLAQALHMELTSDTPRYFTIREMVQEHIRFGSTGPVDGEIYVSKDNPCTCDYAPVIEYEVIPGTSKTTRKKVNVETGEVAVMHWPRSGLCPFCLPVGLTNRRRCKRSLRDIDPY